MAKLPGFMFYPGDWLKEPSLRRCSHAAKGIYIDILCLMFECSERGVLATDGLAWSDEEIAQAVGGDKTQTLEGLRELVGKRVVSRTDKGAVYSRRMVREEKTRQLCSEAGRRGGGNPQFHKGRHKGGGKGANKGPPKGGLEYVNETEIENETSAEESFNRFWSLYPRKVGKRDARGAWKKAVDAIRHEKPCAKVDAVLLIERAVALFSASDKAKGEFCPHPSTWLNQGRYDDDPAAWSQRNGTPPPRIKLSEVGK